jgi:hypothetical protein
MIDYGTLLRDHVTLRCRSIDRIFLQAYVPRLQAVGEVCSFLRWQGKFPIPSSAAFGRIGEEYLKALYRFAETRAIPIVHFKKGQNKEEVARPLSGSRCQGRQGAGGDDRDAAREGLGVEIMAEEGAGESPPSPHALGPGDGLYQPLLFLSLGFGMGRGVLEDQCLCPLPHLAVAQRS